MNDCNCSWPNYMRGKKFFSKLILINRKACLTIFNMHNIKIVKLGFGWYIKSTEGSWANRFIISSCTLTLNLLINPSFMIIV